METTNTETVEIETLINASVQTVWSAWTEPNLITWFGSDPNGKVLNAYLDVRPGGSFEITFRDSDHTKHTCSGVYREVQNFTKLTFSWAWKSEPGVESFVMVLLSPDDQSTRMIFKHALPKTASKHDYSNGWQTTFLKLKQMLEGK